MMDRGHDPAKRSPAVGRTRDTSDAVLLEAVSRGDVPALRTLVDRTSVAVRAVLAELQPGRDRQDEILAASYLEVWWLAGCRTHADADVTRWIVEIARRRAAEMDAGPGPDRDGPRTGHAQLEFASLFRHPIGGVLRR